MSDAPDWILQYCIHIHYPSKISFLYEDTYVASDSQTVQCSNVTLFSFSAYVYREVCCYSHILNQTCRVSYFSSVSVYGS